MLSKSENPFADGHTHRKRFDLNIFKWRCDWDWKKRIYRNVTIDCLYNLRRLFEWAKYAVSMKKNNQSWHIFEILNGILLNWICCMCVWYNNLVKLSKKKLNKARTICVLYTFLTLALIYLASSNITYPHKSDSAITNSVGPTNLLYST